MENAAICFDESTHTLKCQGMWTIASIANLARSRPKLVLSNDITTIDTTEVDDIDGAGALLLYQYLVKDQEKKLDELTFSGNIKVVKMLDVIKKNQPEQARPRQRDSRRPFVYFIGEESHRKLKEIDGFIRLIGELTINMIKAFSKLKHFPVKGALRVMDITGLQGLPIIALLSFLIGVVLAYQMGLQLEIYGANIFIVYLTGMANQREFSPLITAIIVAGRTTSAFTAQIGSMKVNEEIDAIKTMGLSPVELLVFPKLVGVLLIFPILIFWADFFGTLGSMVMARFMLDVSYIDFVQRLKDTLGVKQYLLGLSKAPAFALIIAMVGCYQGLKVQGGANSVGSQTTKSVVQAIFLIIICDALYSVVFSWLGL